MYGLHPKLAELQSLFNSGNAAVMANVGMLVNPNLDRTGYLNGASVPANLFSHSDQTSQWQDIGAQRPHRNGLGRPPR